MVIEVLVSNGLTTPLRARWREVQKPLNDSLKTMKFWLKIHSSFSNIVFDYDCLWNWTGSYNPIIQKIVCSQNLVRYVGIIDWMISLRVLALSYTWLHKISSLIKPNLALLIRSLREHCFDLHRSQKHFILFTRSIMIGTMLIKNA